MRSEPFTFRNSAGRLLSGVIESGEKPPRAYAAFAHCFTCDKSSLAAVRISRALAQRGFGVLRFDFTGLGESEGDFGAGLGGDIDDLIAAAHAMSAAGRPVQALVGHSFGGAAALGAAARIDSVRAVAVIGAPFEAGHVLKHVKPAPGGDRETLKEALIGGRPFKLTADFLEDIRDQNQRERIASLGKALLVLHSPVDDVVSIDNASQIFVTARHPKSFISLDTADHFLRKREDADYAAGAIAAWAERYIVEAQPASAAARVAGVLVSETGDGKFQVEVETPSISFLADEPAHVGGLGSGPTPYELLGAALGACTVMTCRLYADRKNWPLRNTVVEVTHAARQADEPESFTRRLRFEGPLEDEQRARLFEIADKCPVHRTLSHEVAIHTTMDAARAAADADAGAHLRHACEHCDENDARRG